MSNSVPDFNPASLSAGSICLTSFVGPKCSARCCSPAVRDDACEAGSEATAYGPPSRSCPVCAGVGVERSSESELVCSEADSPTADCG